jgi:hypothetical protein
MSKFALRIIWLICAIWTVVILVLSTQIDPSTGEAMGFISTLLVFYPTAAAQTWKFFASRSGRTNPPAAPPGSPAASTKDVETIQADASVAIDVFNWRYVACYFVGISLIALGFGVKTLPGIFA